MKYTKDSLYIGFLFKFRSSLYRIMYLDNNLLSFSNIETQSKFTHGYTEFLNDIKMKRYIPIEDTPFYQIF